MNYMIYIDYIAIAIVLVGVTILSIQHPKKAKQWLLWAVIEAEKELGHNTGKLKLRKVYERFISCFPKLAFFVTFNKFEKWADEAVDEMKQLLKENKEVRSIVEGETHIVRDNI